MSSGGSGKPLPPRAGGSGFIRPPKRVFAYIGLGANLGDARAVLEAATRDIADLPRVQSIERSPLYRSAPVDADGPDFINAVIKAETTLEAEDLLRALHGIENRYGRERPYQNAPRTLDLDLLLHGNELRETAFLTLPHPRMHQRAFVLQPLHDLEPDLWLPHGELAALLAACGDQNLERLSSEPGEATTPPHEPGELKRR